MTYHVLESGKFIVAALESLAEDFTPHCDALEFLKSCYHNKGTTASCNGFKAVFKRYAEHGPSGLTSAMLHEANKEESIQEFIKGDLRLLCFIDRNTIYLTNGYVKKSQKADKTEVARAIQARKKFFADKNN